MGTEILHLEKQPSCFFTYIHKMKSCSSTVQDFKMETSGGSNVFFVCICVCIYACSEIVNINKIKFKHFPRYDFTYAWNNVCGKLCELLNSFEWSWPQPPWPLTPWPPTQPPIHPPPHQPFTNTTHPTTFVP